MPDKWDAISQRFLPEEMAWTGTPSNRTPSMRYSVEEILAAEHLWCFATWGESLMLPEWERTMFEAGETDTMCRMPLDVGEARRAFDIVFLGRAPQPLADEVLDVLSRCRCWHAGGSTGSWTRWAEAEMAEAGFGEHEHPLERLHDAIWPMTQIWEACLCDACFHPGAVMRWDDEHRLACLADVARALGIDSAIDAYQAGVPIEYVLEGKRRYEVSGVLEVEES